MHIKENYRHLIRRVMKDKNLKSDFFVNSEGELVKKIGQSYLPANGLKVTCREVLIVYIGEK